MSGNILRALLLGAGLALLAGAAAFAQAGCSLGAALRLGLPGLLLIGAVLAEPWRYKRLAGGRLSPEWIATQERFVDPETGRLVTVFYRPSTGERRYIAV